MTDPSPDDQKCLPHLFEDQVARTPESTALIFNQEEMSYSSLNKRANAIAAFLVNNGVAKEEVVGLCFERSFDMVAAVLGVIKAGCAYLALDPLYPKERLQFMLNSCEVNYVMTNINHLDISYESTQIVNVQNDIDFDISDTLALKVTPDMLAYIIFTSGSTGQPKGVMIEHKGLPNLIFDHIKIYDLSEKDCVLQHASLSFDASICEIGMALLSGAKLCLANQNDLLPGVDLVRILKENQVTTLTIPPSSLSQLEPQSLPDLRTITVMGEKCPPSLVKRWGEGRDLYNGYGPSEVTVGATIGKMNPEDSTVTIGKPFKGYQVLILDENLKEVKKGESGEIGVVSIGLARGYLNHQELTDKKFVTIKSEGSEKRIYRTGDLGRILEDGNIEFLGRNDNLIKIRGKRVELEEIEHQLLEHENVKEVAVKPLGEGASMRLVAFIVFGEATEANATEIQKRLLVSLPGHMVPSEYFGLEKLPRLPNGKIDRKALDASKGSKLERSESALIEKPKTKTEKKLLKIWKRVLQRDDIGVTDNFFDLGGHSLLAVQMFTMIENKLGKQLPLSLLINNRTIRELADHLELEDLSKDWSSIVRLRPDGDRKPLYLVHTPSGNVFSYRFLLADLPKDIPVFGLQAKGLNTQKIPHFSLEEMAAYYVQCILDFQPEGPYYIGGYCFGGLIAYEMARMLQSKGKKVGNVFLIGSDPPNVVVPLPDTILSDEKIQRSDVGHLEGMRDMDISDKIEYLKQGTKRLTKRYQKRVWKRIFYFCKNNNLPLPKVLRHLNYINREAFLNYTSGPYEGDVVLIQGEEQDYKYYYKPLKGWESLVSGKVEVFKIPGDQDSILKEPYATELAKCIEQSF